jgi:hypothetical protein
MEQRFFIVPFLFLGTVRSVTTRAGNLVKGRDTKTNDLCYTVCVVKDGCMYVPPLLVEKSIWGVAKFQKQWDGWLARFEKQCKMTCIRAQATLPWAGKSFGRGIAAARFVVRHDVFTTVQGTHCYSVSILLVTSFHSFPPVATPQHLTTAATR